MEAPIGIVSFSTHGNWDLSALLSTSADTSQIEAPIFHCQLPNATHGNYLVSFYFWVDLISLLSMVPDLTLVMDGVQDSFGGGAGEGSDIAKNARATRVIKIIRIIRIIRLLRVLKIYKQVKTGQKVRNQQL